MTSLCFFIISNNLVIIYIINNFNNIFFVSKFKISALCVLFLINLFTNDKFLFFIISNNLLIIYIVSNFNNTRIFFISKFKISLLYLRYVPHCVLDTTIYTKSQN